MTAHVLARQSIIELNITRPVVVCAPRVVRRPFISSDLLNWRSTPAMAGDVHVAGSDLPPRDLGLVVQPPRWRLNPPLLRTWTSGALRRTKNSPVDSGNVGTVDVQRSAEVGNGATRAAWSPSTLQRYRHLGSHRSERRYLTSTRSLKVALAAFIAVSWPLYGVAVWLVNT